VLGDRDEAVMGVEAGCGLVEGVHHGEAGSSHFSGSHSLSQRLGEECSTESPALIASVDGQSGEQGHPNGVLNRCDNSQWYTTNTRSSDRLGA